MLYAAKCYWPGVTQADLQQVAGRAADTGLDTGTGLVTYLGALLFAADDLVLCLFDGPSPATVIQASDQLRIPPNASWNRSGSAHTGAARKEHRMIKLLGSSDHLSAPTRAARGRSRPLPTPANPL